MAATTVTAMSTPRSTRNGGFWPGDSMEGTPRTKPQTLSYGPSGAVDRLGGTTSVTAMSTPRSARNGGTVPFLPGYSVNGGTANPRKAQTLAYGPGGAMDRSGASVPRLDLDTIAALKNPMTRYNMSARSMTHDERAAEKDSARNTYRPAIAPAWLMHDRQVLGFFAYFQEPVHENPKENFRVRHCLIYFYLEDGTMMITEPKVQNSGIPQGTFVKRHRIPRPKSNGGYYTYEDLVVGMDINIYSRVFKIMGCDEFTRVFYKNASDFDQPEDMEPPMDSFLAAELLNEARAASPRNRQIAEGKEYNELVHGGSRKNAKLQQYLENDRKVLSFKCFWDDLTRYGCRLYYVLHYYLADDTVEMLETLARNSGRDPYPVFWRRSPLRKNPHVVPAPGMLEPEAIIYKPEDFIVGSMIQVYGRDIYLYQCDDSTRDFYKSYMNHEQDHQEIQEPPLQHVVLNYPPHTGIGTEEDSLGNCKNLTPRVPRRDINKLMNDSDKVMRFEARMANNQVEDMNRRFIVCVYPADGSVAIWETKERNSGHAAGKFAAKTRKQNPMTGKWFEPQDFAVGETVEINTTPFYLTDADENTFEHMESNPDLFPVADAGTVAAKIVGLRQELAKRSAFAVDEIESLAQEKLGVQLSTHELITLMRGFGEMGGPESRGCVYSSKLLEHIY